MDAGDTEACGGELGGLIVHEGNKRANDESSAASGYGGKLVTETLTGSCGHDEQDVSAVSCGAADSLLIGSKRGEAEGLME